MSPVTTPARIAVDRYVLCDPIAVGGMATVYFARQRGAAGFSKAVAIKRMRPDLVHQREFADLFLDEARLASRVRHANVVSVVDVIASGEELLLVMEYIHGESLERLLAAAARDKKRFPVAVAVAIACNVLHGLHAAHEAKSEKGEPLGIVHRDVSPHNVLVGVDGVARVADFGIARAVGQIHATDEGTTRGKAAYSAPEQLRGGVVTRRIDLFAACVLLWEMLAGRRLFEGETQAAVVASVLTAPIEPPGLYAPDLPQELDDIVAYGLDRDPRRRLGTALELATALECVLTPASPATVAAWVMELAHEGLTERERVMRRVEDGIDDRDAPSLRSTSRSGEGLTLSGPDAGTVGSLATSRSPSVAPPPSRSRWFPVVAVAAGVVIGLAGIATAIVSRRGATAVIASPPAIEAPPPVTSSALPIAPSDIGSAAAWGSATSLPSASAPSAPPPLPSVGATKKPAPKRCDPPYALDGAGRKIFRVECL